MTKGPLDGIRVIELTHAWAGPYCGMMLGDMGAEVIKIESPRQQPEARGGFPYVGKESVIFMMLHRNKKSVTLDLKAPEGKEIFLELVRSADVLIQNFRPGVMEKLGLTYEELKKVKPELIYASLSGFGQTGPKASLPGVNMIALAASGLASTTIYEDQPPIPIGYALCDVVASMWTAYAILAAYINREKTGEGQQVDMSLYEAGLSLMFSPLAQWGRIKGKENVNSRNDSNAPSAFFPTSDGTYVAVFASYPALWDRFVKTMDLQHLTEDPRFANRNSRTNNAAELHAILHDIFITDTADHWVEKLTEGGVPASPVNDVGRLLRDEQAHARQMIVEQNHPTAGNIQMIGVPVKLSGTPGGIHSAAPLLGQHTEEIICGLGFASQLEALREKGVLGPAISEEIGV